MVASMQPVEYRRDVEYFIEMPGLASDCVGSVGFDGKYACVQLHPTYSLVITPEVGHSHPTYVELVYYANCLSYDHDLPVFISSSKAKALQKPIESGPPRYIDRGYFKSMGVAFEALNAIRLGPLGCVYFRWPGYGKEIEIYYSTKYSKVLQELGLYSTALKQVDPLSEFLNYYRIIESVSGDNGKTWIRVNLPKLSTYDFGFLHFSADLSNSRSKRRINLFNVYRRRALSRLHSLQGRPSGLDIADYFYNELRCGIAHGKTDVKDYDYGFNVIEVSKDIYIIKLLARMALEAK
jgi:hypothetical protein